jgi:hypothetical protein
MEGIVDLILERGVELELVVRRPEGGWVENLYFK